MSDSDDTKTIFYDASMKAEIRQHQDGTTEMITHGNTIKHGKDGNTDINFENIKAIGIKNIPDITKYSIENDGTKITHRFKFCNGTRGVLSFLVSGEF